MPQYREDDSFEQALYRDGNTRRMRYRVPKEWIEVYGLDLTNIVRVEYRSDGKIMTCYEDGWNTTTELPAWMQPKIALLMTVDPHERSRDIPGVGRRITDTIFWIYKNGNKSE